MANKITLYRNCRILEANNFQVDSIDTYLTSIGSNKLEFADCQYIKNDLDLEIKINLGQDYLDKNVLNNYNYCVVQNDTGSKYYYFIRKMIWTAKSTIKLECHLDVLNTYSGKYSLSDKTNIIRQHKDRIKILSPEYPAQTLIKESWLDDSEWDWSTGAGEIIGQAKFNFDFEPINRRFTATVSLIQGSGADIYEFTYNGNGELMITAYVQGEESEVPTGKIRITAVAPLIPAVSSKKRIIDEEPEGIDSVLFNKAEYTINTQNADNKYDYDSSYLIYRAHNAFNAETGDKFIYQNPIDCLYCTNFRTNIKVGAGVEIYKNQLSVGKRYFITWPVAAGDRVLDNSFAVDFPNPKENYPKVNIWYWNGETYEKSAQTYMEKINKNRDRQYAFAFYRYKSEGEDYIKCFEVSLARNNYVLEIKEFSEKPEKLLFENITSLTAYHSTETSNWPNAYTNWNWLLLQKKWLPNSLFNDLVEGVDKTIKAYSEVDDTDQKLVKIIKYPVRIYTWGQSELEWSEDDQLAKINTGKLKSKVIDNVQLQDLLKNRNTLQSVFEIVVPNSISGNELRNDYYESKLNNSDFAHYSFVYDSFNYDIKPELIDYFGYNSGEYIKVVVPTSVSSSFLFDFKELIEYKKSMQSYPTILCVNRNNEMPIYNNYYLNYLRSGGMSADQKNASANKVAAGVGIGLGIVGTAAGIAMAATGWGAAPGAAAAATGIAGITKATAAGVSTAVAGAVSTAGSIASAISQSTAADRALQQKQEAAKQQSASVSGADDIGLLTYYSKGNHPKWVYWEVSDNTKKRIADLFYYCGYNCNYQGIPNSTSRYWFNYIQCEPVFDDGSTYAKLSNEIKSELSNKLKSGITVLHYHSTWDFDQVKENWETWLIH